MGVIFIINVLFSDYWYVYIIQFLFPPAFWKATKCTCVVWCCHLLELFKYPRRNINTKQQKSLDGLWKLNKNHHNETRMCLRPHADSLKHYEEDTKVTTNHFLLSWILGKLCIYNLNVLHPKFDLKGLICLNRIMGLKPYLNSQYLNIQERGEAVWNWANPNLIPWALHCLLEYHLIPSNICFTYMTWFALQPLKWS